MTDPTDNIVHPLAHPASALDKTPEPELTLSHTLNTALDTLAEGDITSPSGKPHVHADGFPARHRLAGRFVIARRLGQGGLGTVYVAHDTHLGRNVAIKALRMDRLNTHQRLHWLQTFRREATATARLQHPNITTLHDFGYHEGIPFLVLERLHGQTLRSLLAKGPLPPASVLNLAQQLCHALHHAHSRRIIHRDLKPANIFVEPDERLKILDFGIALLKAQSHTLAHDLGLDDETLNERLGQTPDNAGTPIYMAPEQIVGKEQNTHTDLWALGIVLYEMLTNERPFKHPLQTLHDPLPSLNTPQIPPSLRDIIRHCLHKDPNQRPASATDVLAMLKAINVESIPTTPPPKQPHRLINAPDAFVARQRELRALDTTLAQGARLITIVGTPGCGKTRLALEWAQAQHQRFDHIFFCELADAHSANALATVVGQALNTPLTQAKPLEQLTHVLAGHANTLLVLDNFEQLIEFTDISVARWLTAAPQTTLLVTSRQRLNLSDECFLQLKPLPLPTSPRLKSLRRNDAVRLFLTRAREHHADFVLHEGNAQAVADLVKALDGLPLAIELAAARVRVLAPQTMLKKMSRRFDLLKSKRRDLNTRQRTLQGALEWSWDLLTPWEQSALAQASVFEQGFTLDTAEMVIDLVDFDEAPFIIDVIESLVDKNLIRVWTSSRGGATLDEPRFGLLVSIQAFAAQRWTEMVQGTSRRNRLLHRLIAGYARFGTDDAIESLNRFGGLHRLRALGLDRDNLLNALQHSVALEDWLHATQLMAACFEIFAMQGPFQQGIELLSDMLERSAHHDDIDATIIMRWVGWRGRLLWRAGAWDKARMDLREATRLACALGDVHREGVWRAVDARIDWRQGRTAQAREGYQRAHEIARQLGTRRLEGRYLGNIACLDFEQGRLDEAHAKFIDALVMIRDAGDQQSENICLGNLALLDQEQGRSGRARQRYTQVLKLARHVGDRRSIAVHRGNLANLDREQGDLEAARRGYEESIGIARLLGDRRLESINTGNLALVNRDAQRFDDARTGFIRAIALARALSDRRGEGINTGNLALLDLAEKKFRAARQRFEEALGIARQLSDPRFEAIWQADLAKLDHAEGHLEDARQRFLLAETQLRDLSDDLELANLLAARGLLDLAQERRRDAQHALNESDALAQTLQIKPSSALAGEIERLRSALHASPTHHRPK